MYVSRGEIFKELVRKGKRNVFNDKMTAKIPRPDKLITNSSMIRNIYWKVK